MTLRVLLVEDHGLLADSVAAVFRANGIETVRSTTLDFADIEREAAVFRPDLVLLDLGLGDVDSTPLIAPVTAAGALVVMVTAVTDRIRLAACVEAGAVGLVDKSRPVDDLLDAVHRVVDDGSLFTAGAREDLLRDLRAARSAEQERLAPFEALTPREREVLAGLVVGHSAETMAARAFVSMATVRSQIRAVLVKLGANSQIAAVAMARDAGWDAEN